MSDSSKPGDDRGNLERLGENAGALAGRAADFGMEVSGAVFRSAAEMLGGWWSSDEPTRAVDAFDDRAATRFRSHYSESAAGSMPEATGTPNVAPKSKKGAMQTAGQMTTATDGSGAYATGSATVGDAQLEGEMALDSTSDGFARALPGYQLGYVARRNPTYQGRPFSEIEPDLQKVWESRTKTVGGSTESSSTWPEVRGFVDFAYQQDD